REDRVANESKAQAVAEVEHCQHQAAALEMQVRVAPARHFGGPAGADCPVLHTRLDQQPQGAFGVDQIPGVREGEAHAAVDRAARVAPGPIGAGQESELDQQIERPSGKRATEGARHLAGPPWGIGAEVWAEPYSISVSEWHRGPELITRPGAKSTPTRKRPGVWTSSIV